MNKTEFKSLESYLVSVPSIKSVISYGYYENGLWWVKFQIDIQNPLSWHVVQEIGCVVNYLSIDERLPTIFYPVSPAPYLNGGPSEFLSWIIESKDDNFSPDNMQEWLFGRLPRPVEDLEQWGNEE